MYFFNDFHNLESVFEFVPLKTFTLKPNQKYWDNSHSVVVQGTPVKSGDLSTISLELCVTIILWYVATTDWQNKLSQQMFD